MRNDRHAERSHIIRLRVFSWRELKSGRGSGEEEQAVYSTRLAEFDSVINV